MPCTQVAPAILRPKAKTDGMPAPIRHVRVFINPAPFIQSMSQMPYMPKEIGCCPYKWNFCSGNVALVYMKEHKLALTDPCLCD